MIIKKVRLEACSMCQLKCPCCSTAKGKNKNGAVGWGYLKFSDFKTFIDRNPRIQEIELSNYGEIFLNPEIDMIIEYAFKKGTALTAYNGVNLNNVKSSTIIKLVKYKFKGLKVSIDGTTNAVYSKYRQNGNLDKVIQNIEEINYLKKLYKSEYPTMIWSFILFGHNEEQIPEAKKMAKTLGMKIIYKLNFDEKKYSPIINEEYVRKQTGLDVIYRKDLRKKGKRYFGPCEGMWTAPQINWDGKLLGCCCNKWGDYGNVFQDGFEKILNSKKYLLAKDILLGKKEIRDGMPCFKCSYYHDFVKKKPIIEDSVLL